jgi:hypothetical protein
MDISGKIKDLNFKYHIFQYDDIIPLENIVNTTFKGKYLLVYSDIQSNNIKYKEVKYDYQDSFCVSFMDIKEKHLLFMEKAHYMNGWILRYKYRLDKLLYE